MDFNDIRGLDVELFAARKRFRAFIWHEAADDVYLKEVRLESGEVLLGPDTPFASLEDAKDAAREVVERWAAGR